MLEYMQQQALSHICSSSRPKKSSVAPSVANTAMPAKAKTAMTAGDEQQPKKKPRNLQARGTSPEASRSLYDNFRRKSGYTDYDIDVACGADGTIVNNSPELTAFIGKLGETCYTQPLGAA